MGDLLQRGAAMRARIFRSSVSQQVTYVRSDVVIATFQATPGIRKGTEVTSTGDVAQVFADEFIVNLDDFGTGDEATIEIRKGDTIRWGSRTFKVLPPAPPAQPRQLDAYGLQIGIQVEEVFS